MSEISEFLEKYGAVMRTTLMQQSDVSWSNSFMLVNMPRGLCCIEFMADISSILSMYNDGKAVDCLRVKMCANQLPSGTCLCICENGFDLKGLLAFPLYFNDTVRKVQYCGALTLSMLDIGEIHSNIRVWDCFTGEPVTFPIEYNNYLPDMFRINFNDIKRFSESCIVDYWVKKCINPM